MAEEVGAFLGREAVDPMTERMPEGLDSSQRFGA